MKGAYHTPQTLPWLWRPLRPWASAACLYNWCRVVIVACLSLALSPTRAAPPGLVAAGGADAPLDAPVSPHPSPSASVSRRRCRRSSRASAAAAPTTRGNGSKWQGGSTSGPFTVKLEQELQRKMVVRFLSWTEAFLHSSIYSVEPDIVVT